MKWFSFSCCSKKSAQVILSSEIPASGSGSGSAASAALALGTIVDAIVAAAVSSSADAVAASVEEDAENAVAAAAYVAAAASRCVLADSDPVPTEDTIPGPESPVDHETLHKD